VKDAAEALVLSRYVERPPSVNSQQYLERADPYGLAVCLEQQTFPKNAVIVEPIFLDTYLTRDQHRPSAYLP
jgi:hypothetical protein